MASKYHKTKRKNSATRRLVEKQDQRYWIKQKRHRRSDASRKQRTADPVNFWIRHSSNYFSKVHITLAEQIWLENNALLASIYTTYAPRYQQCPNYKAGTWNGKITNVVFDDSTIAGKKQCNKFTSRWLHNLLFLF